jgi:hypothetical protein
MMTVMTEEWNLIIKVAICFKKNKSWVLVAHACNPSYTRGRNQEDQGSKPAQANSLWDPILRPSQKRAGGVVHHVGPEFKPQYHKKNFFLKT